MGELKEIKSRWSQAMPKFFKKVMWLCGLISGTALAVNESLQLIGAEPDEWWKTIFPYLVSIPAGAMFAAKFTVSGGVAEDREDKIYRNGEMVDRDAAAPNMSDVDTQQPE